MAKKTPEELAADADDDDEVIDDPVAEGDETDEHDDETVDDPAGESESDPDDGVGGEEELAAEEEPKGKRQGRANTAISSLRKRTQEAERLAAEATRRAEEAERRATERQTQEQQRAEEARRQYMTPEELARDDARKLKDETDRKFNQVGFMLADQNDQKAFERECRKNPALDALADEVEEVLARERAKGLSGAPRAAIARYLLGDKALKAAARKKGTMGKQAERSKAANQAKGGAAKSNVKVGGERGGDERAKRAKRLENVIL